MAKWSLLSSVTFYMYVPTADKLGEAGTQARSFISYDEIRYLEILSQAKLGRFSVNSDAEKCSQVLRHVGGIKVTEITGGIRVELLSSRVNSRPRGKRQGLLAYVPPNPRSRAA